MKEILERTIEGLKRRGFEAVGVATKAEALKLVMDEAEKAQSVGWGGSESVKEIGAREAIVATGKEIRDHQTVMDLFLLSANAITSDGVIVNIDGTGNRIAASIFGPKRVVYVIGRNKVVEFHAHIRCFDIVVVIVTKTFDKFVRKIEGIIGFNIFKATVTRTGIFKIHF